MKLLEMDNLCVDESAPMSVAAHAPQAIVKPGPLARSAGGVNLSTPTYRYLIPARVGTRPRLWDWPSEACMD